MKNEADTLIWDKLKSSALFRMSGTAFNLIKEGKDKQARLEFPLEYYLIKKYLPSSLDELTSLLSRKLKVF